LDETTMNPYQSYLAASAVESTRIDMLLALFNRAIERLESASASLKAGRDSEALPLLTRAQMVVCELAAGVDSKYDGAANFLRLYEFVGHAISERTAAQADAALQVLCTLRAGFQAIRPEAAALEQSGAVPRLHNTCLVQAMA
jgi:flagellin-specific chaperone FliS